MVEGKGHESEVRKKVIGPWSIVRIMDCGSIAPLHACQGFVGKAAAAALWAAKSCQAGLDVVICGPKRGHAVSGSGIQEVLCWVFRPREKVCCDGGMSGELADGRVLRVEALAGDQGCKTVNQGLL